MCEGVCVWSHLRGGTAAACTSDACALYGAGDWQVHYCLYVFLGRGFS